MPSFDVAFQDNNKLIVSDTTDYSALTVTKTDIRVTYPNILTSTAITLDLYDENVASLGDDIIYNSDSEALLSEFVDGVYKIELLIYNGLTLVDSGTLYKVQDYSVKACRRTAMQKRIDNNCEDLELINTINSFLQTAKNEAFYDRFVSAQAMMDYLAVICAKTDCGGCQ